MLKFFAWVFGATSRHWQGIRTYEKGLGGRIWTLILMLLLLGGCVASEYWFLTFINGGIKQSQYPVLGTIGIICLLACLLIMSFDYSVTFCYVAFKNAFFGIIMTAARLAEKKKKKKRAQEEEVAMDEEASVEVQEGEERKTHKALDIVIGILGIVCAIGTVASGFIVFAAYA